MRFLIVIAIVLASVYYCTGGKYGTSTLFGPPDIRNHAGRPIRPPGVKRGSVRRS